MDVGLPLDQKGRLSDEADLIKQAEIYRFVAMACLQQPRCTAFQTWGFTDKYTWVPGFTKGAKGAPLLFDQVYATKPSYTALLNVLRQGRASPP
jgi:endo-1,4-beta-xylanase